MTTHKEALTLALEAYSKNERHRTLAETRYWCDQYKQIATEAVKALAKQEQSAEHVGEPVADPFADIHDKRIGELTAEQQDRAVEFWLRNQKGWLSMSEREHVEALLRVIDNLRTTPYVATQRQQRKPLMLEKFREMEALLDDNPHQHKKIFTDDELKIIMETTMPVIDWKARYGVELNNGERNKWMLEWFIAFARAIEAAHGIKE